MGEHKAESGEHIYVSSTVCVLGYEKIKGDEKEFLELEGRRWNGKARGPDEHFLWSFKMPRTVVAT